LPYCDHQHHRRRATAASTLAFEFFNKITHALKNFGALFVVFRFVSHGLRGNGIGAFGIG
jgi:hypothetical protein